MNRLVSKKMHCLGCGRDFEGSQIFEEYYDGSVENQKTCGVCEPTSKSSGNFAWANHKERIYETATKKLSSSKHVYVPPKDEGTVGGVFRKE